jgi:transcriptional regulator GlxA family with amidase domain
MFSAGISRVPDVRWMADGKYYSCSGSAAGMDMAPGVIADILDIDVATRIVSDLGYRWAYEDEEGILL